MDGDTNDEPDLMRAFQKFIDESFRSDPQLIIDEVYNKLMNDESWNDDLNAPDQ